MTDDLDKKDQTQTLDALLARVSRVSNKFDLRAIRFKRCGFSYDTVQDGQETVPVIDVVEQQVELEHGILSVSMRFQFASPSPFEDESDQRVDVWALLIAEYSVIGVLDSEQREDIEVFGKVNGIYNSWPYIREYLRSSLIRMSLPPFELPLLRAPAAARLAGLIEFPEEPDESDESSD